MEALTTPVEFQMIRAQAAKVDTLQRRGGQIEAALVTIKMPDNQLITIDSWGRTIKWYNPANRLPLTGRAVLVRAVVRYGRKEQLMAAKLMKGWGPKDDYWVALKEGCNYEATIKLRKVIAWRYIS